METKPKAQTHTKGAVEQHGHTLTPQEIYKRYDDYKKPYSKIDATELHKEVLAAIDSIGNANPHWNKLNEIELELQNPIF